LLSYRVVGFVFVTLQSVCEVVFVSLKSCPALAFVIAIFLPGVFEIEQKNSMLNRW